MILGIDLGTTKTAAVLYDPVFPEQTIAVSLEHKAALPGAAGCAELDWKRLQESVSGVLEQLPLAGITAIGLTGQMHSAMLWSHKEISPVITWQDGRASAAGKLETLRRASGLPLADGFGGCTLGFLALEGTLGKWQHAATPVDFLAACMTQREPVTDPSFAASWGIFDGANWNRAACDALKIPQSLLPQIVPFGSVIGRTSGFMPLPDGIPVVTPIGDNQASIIGSSQHIDDELFVTIGTGAQISAVLSAAEAAAFPATPGVELRPFPGNRVLAVAAPLCGGRAWAWLGNAVNGFLADLGLTPLPEKELLDRLDALAFRAAPGNGLGVTPAFLGERHAPGLRGSIDGITLDNFTLPNLAEALAAGIARSLCGRIPAEIAHRRKLAVGSGNAIRHCASIRAQLEAQLGLPLEVRQIKEEAATGAAKYAKGAFGK